MNPTNVARYLKKKTPLRTIHKHQLDIITVIDEDTTTSNEFQESKNENAVSFNEQLQSLNEKGITLQQPLLTTDEFHKLVNLIHRNRDLFATSMNDLVGLT